MKLIQNVHLIVAGIAAGQFGWHATPFIAAAITDVSPAAAIATTVDYRTVIFGAALDATILFLSIVAAWYKTTHLDGKP